MSPSQRGAANRQAKLSEKDARAILDLAPKTSRAELAKRYGVSVACIADLLKGRSWGFLPRTPKAGMSAAPHPAPLPPKSPDHGPKAPKPAPDHGPDHGPQPDVEQLGNSAAKQSPNPTGKGGFKPGQSGNPAGKPKGTRHHATRLAEALIDGRANELVNKAVEMAIAGDPTAMRIVMDRLCPPRRERAIQFDGFPKITSAADLVTATAAIAAGVSQGDLTPTEATALSAVVAGVGRAIEVQSLEDRLTKLEEHLAAKGGNP